MIPYFEQPSVEILGRTIHAFQVLVCLAVIVGFEITVRRAPRVGLDRDRTASLVAWTIVIGFVGSHLFDVLIYYPERLRHDPHEHFKVSRSMSSFGGILGGLAGGSFVMWRRGLDRTEILREIDNVAFAFPFAWVFGRLGCALAHDHLGIRSDHFLAVRFPGGSAFDLGLLEFLFIVPVAILWFGLDRSRRWPPGFFVGLFFALYGPVRFGLDTLRVADARYLGWTPGQYASLGVAALGAALLAASLRGRLGEPAPALAR